MPPYKHHTVAEKQRVLEAYQSGLPDWLQVSANNGLAPSAVRDLIARGRAENLPRGGVKHSKMTEEAKTYLEQYLNENCTHSLETLRTMLFLDCGVKVSKATISRHLIGMLYTVKQVRVEPTTCNSEVDLLKRQTFAKQLEEHQEQGNCIVYYDETSFNVHLKRQKGRAKRGKRAVLKLPPSNGANLQVHCAVSSSIRLVTYRLQRGSIRMDKNAVFVEEIYAAVKASEEFRMYCKTELAIFRDEVRDRTRDPDQNEEVLSIAERQMRLLERTAKHKMKWITPVLVSRMELHCSKAVNAAADGKAMEYGT